MFTEFMVKDYVKSVKGTRFPVSFHTPVSQERMDGIVKEFVKLRGDLFTVGIVCKEYVDLVRYLSVLMKRSPLIWLTEGLEN